MFSYTVKNLSVGKSEESRPCTTVTNYKEMRDTALGLNPVQFSIANAIAMSPPDRRKPFFYLEEASMTSLPLRDAVHVLLQWLHRCWKIGWDMAVR